jgi:hypothetical protein
MSSEPNPAAPRTRLPFEEAQRQTMVATWAAGAVYIVGAIAMLGFAGYMAFVQQREIASVPVAAPAFGALYFCIRAIIVLRPRLTGK